MKAMKAMQAMKSGVVAVAAMVCGTVLGETWYYVSPNGNFRVSNDSPVINKGLDGLRTKDDRDLDGNSRVVRRHVDMGCYENQNTWGAIFLVK